MDVCLRQQGLVIGAAGGGAESWRRSPSDSRSGAVDHRPIRSHDTKWVTLFGHLADDVSEALIAASMRFHQLFVRRATSVPARLSRPFSHLPPFHVRFLYTPNMPVRDPSTASNYDAWLTKHTAATFTIDFDAERLRGSVVLELESRTDGASNEIVLDSSHVDVSAVKLNSAEAKWALDPRSEPLGSPLRVAVPGGAAKGETVRLAIELATTSKCTALQWLTPAQTSNKKAPFVFSQAQAIHARSLFPCQDTPDVKSTYDFAITSPYYVVASGLKKGHEDLAAAGGKGALYRFEQKIPIPSYLFALASGDLAAASIGHKSDVITGPDEVDGCQWELAPAMEQFIEAAEKIVFPYRWGEYNVLVLPPSFPYGGKLRWF